MHDEDDVDQAHREQVQRGVIATLNYLKTKFPKGTVNSSADAAHGALSVKVQDGNVTRNLRVGEDVLDLDAAWVGELLHQLDIARALARQSQERSS